MRTTDTTCLSLQREYYPHYYLTLTLADAEMSVEQVKGCEMNFPEGPVVARPIRDVMASEEFKFLL